MIFDKTYTVSYAILIPQRYLTSTNTANIYWYSMQFR